ncbi:MAG: DUF1499 domain-containing protein [Rhizobacter sp.]|nr:DUF1499 domain-containing protein [Rhizobacter sp.]
MSQRPEPSASAGALALALILAGCASSPPTPEADGPSEASVEALACTLRSNCVNSTGGGNAGPLRFVGSPEQAMAALQATLATLAEVQVVRSEPLRLETVFTTLLGFRDQVDFRIDPQARRIDYRSRSMFGLFDFGKNRSRMQDVVARFEKQG